jgi:hypothetical protein
MAGAVVNPRLMMCYYAWCKIFAGGPVADETGGALGQAGWSCGWCIIPFVIKFNNRKGVGLLLGVRWWLE